MQLDLAIFTHAPFAHFCTIFGCPAILMAGVRRFLRHRCPILKVEY